MASTRRTMGTNVSIVVFLGLIVLAGIVVLFFVVTLAKLGGNVLNRPL